MTRYSLDSGIASDLINRRGLVHERVREARLLGDRIGIGTPVLGELLAGIENSQSRDRNLANLWHGIRGLNHWTFDKEAGETESWALPRAHQERPKAEGHQDPGSAKDLIITIL